MDYVEKVPSVLYRSPKNTLKLKLKVCILKPYIERIAGLNACLFHAGSDGRILSARVSANMNSLQSACKKQLTHQLKQTLKR